MNRPIFSKKESQVASQEIFDSLKYGQALEFRLRNFAEGEMTHHEFAESVLRLMEHAYEAFEVKVSQMHDDSANCGAV